MGDPGSELTNGFTSSPLPDDVPPSSYAGQSTPPPPIAIVGIGLRLPQGIHSTESLWDLLINRKTTRGIVPTNRYNIDAFYSATKKPGFVNSQHGHFLSEDVKLECLDTSLFSLSKGEVEQLDPQQRILLEVVWECMQNGGQTNWRGGNIGVYVGTWSDDWLDLAARETQDARGFGVTGCGDFAISNRVSYEYNLKGPSITIKTACSGSMIGLNEACHSLYSGDCDGAIVAGTNLIIGPTMTAAQTQVGVLSPTGECRTFDATANGYSRGEAVNAIYIKRLDDALRAGDPIRGVIRATVSNCDGKTAGFTLPNPEAHERMIRRAYEKAQLTISETTFVECHGTGTPTGDPLELEAIAKVFGSDKGVYIGSIKPNIGHSEGASGISSVIKAVLILENRLIPPNVNFSIPNPKIPFEEANLKVPLDVILWPENTVERVSVNSFGVTGSNAHAIIDSATSFLGRSAASICANSVTRHQPQLLVFSANSSESLKMGIEQTREYLDSNLLLLKDISYTLGTRRDHMSHRAFAVADGTTPFEVLTAGKPKKVPKITFVFTGQGAQWGGMGKELMRDFPSFKADINTLNKVLRQLPDPPSWDLEEELLKKGTESRLEQAQFAQPLCTAIQVCIVNLLRSIGVSPTAIVGHSSGEIGGAYAAGAITAEEAIIIAYYRGLSTSLCGRNGGMAAVGMGRAEVGLYLRKGVVIACENSPLSITLSGDPEELDAMLKEINEEEPEIFARHLRTGGIAYHSDHMKDIGKSYENLLKLYIASRAPRIPFFSSVTGKLATASEDLGPSYWRRNLESPVLFYSAVVASLEDEEASNVLFLEIGPHSALAGPLRQIFKSIASKKYLSYVSALTRGKDCTESFLKMAGQLFLQAISIKFEVLTPCGTVLTNMPRYQWRHDTSHWYESRLSKEWRFRKFPRHEILGVRILEGNEFEPTWRNILRLNDVPWLRDHSLHTDIVYPCAGYIGMACEAMRQLSEVADFSLRRIEITRALVLTESENVEMITSLRPVRLTNTLDSDWYNFTVSSYKRGNWERHCSGQIKAGPDFPLFAHEIASLPRAVADSYMAMKKVGLNYGPAFQALSDISTSPGQFHAVATLLEPNVTDSYTLHPTTIDQCLQLFALASANGLTRQLAKLHVPTEIDQLYIGGESKRGMRAEAKVSTKTAGSIVGDGLLVADSRVLLCLKGGKFLALEDGSNVEDTDTVAATRLEWRPDIDFIDITSLIEPCFPDPKILELGEQFTALCMLEMGDRLSSPDLPAERPSHLVKFAAWLHVQVTNIITGKDQLYDSIKRLPDLDSEARLALMKSIREQLASTEAHCAVELSHGLLEHAEKIFTGEMDALDVMLQGENLANFYKLVDDKIDYRNFFAAAGHSNPILRILEIGAGTGMSTQSALDGLTTAYGEKTYSQFCFSDISAGFFPAARERFSAYQGIEYKILDISKDPLAQGFEASSFDLIIASNVLHATPELSTTLKNVRKLLQPRGKLFMLELMPSKVQFINFIMGFMPGWWLGEADGRPDRPFVSVERWDEELKKAGFQGVEAKVFNDPRDDWHINACIVARLPQPEKDRNVTLLCPTETSVKVDQIQETLESQGYKIDRCTLGEKLPSHQDVISLLELGAPIFHDISEGEFDVFKKFVEGLGSAGVLWVTNSIQINCTDPRYALTLGLSRAMRTELSIPFATLELDSIDTPAYSAIVHVFDKFHARNLVGVTDPDWEFAFSNGVINVGRFHWVSVVKELASVSTEEQRPMKLEIGRPGLLRSLGWVQYPLPALGADQVEIEVKHVGLNFRDVLLSMGIIQANAAGLGLEGSGIVKAIGPEVQGLLVGDRVMMMAINCFATVMITPAKCCHRIPDNLSFEAAATMPSVYSTVIHSLIKMASLQKNQTVLIHSACGGVGIAAIQICQMIGAKIYVTVGNEEKVRYVMKTFGIERSCIFNSRDTSFYQDVMRVTDNKGIDVVLNSLSGELLHTSWQCVKEHGKMVEIGKRDFIGRAQLNMDLFEANRAFIGVDLARFTPERIQPLLADIVSLYEQGFIKPIEPMKVFDGASIEDPFRYMQKGLHIGKIVVKIPNNQGDEVLPVTDKVQALELNPQRTYLMVGGLGGLGKAISNWMVECGARDLIYLSRSAGQSDEDQIFFKELESQGCSVQAVAGDVTKLEDVENAVAAAAKPIAGALQLSMVLRDGPFLKMSHENWKAATGPKVAGTWYLHHALANSKLDFFLLFGSGSGLFGWTHQANYASGNAFLDAFVQYRQNLGLPASVIDVGVMSEIGYVSQTPVVADALRAAGNYSLSEKDLIDAIHLMIARSTSRSSLSARGNSFPFISHEQLAIGLRSLKPISDLSNRLSWRRDARTSIYHANEASVTSNSPGRSDALDAFISSVVSDCSILTAEGSLELVTREIGSCIYGFMLRAIEDLDVAQPLTELGIDSLVTVEIRNWWRRKLGVEISTLEILGGGTIQGLGVLAMTRLQEKYSLKL